MEIKRDRYLNKLISFMWDGQVKVITGIRRCGKSYLLRNLFRTYLLGEGVPADHILSFELDLTRDIRYRNPLELANRVREIVENQREQFYLFVDEIQMSDEVPNPYNPDGKKITFYDALNDLKSLSRKQKFTSVDKLDDIRCFDNRYPFDFIFQALLPAKQFHLSALFRPQEIFYCKSHDSSSVSFS